MYPETPQQPPVSLYQPPKPSKKKPILIIISIVVILLIGVATVLVLMNLKKEVPAAQTDTKITLKEVDAPEVIIKDYSAATIETRSTDYTQRQIIANDGSTTPVVSSTKENGVTSPTNTFISYESKGTFATTIPVTEYVQYERKDKSNKDNSSQAIDQTKSFLKSKGLVEISTSTTKSGVVYTNYDSTNVYCQMSENTIDPSYPAVFGVACVLKTFITDRYSQINTLLKLSSTDYTAAKTITIGLDITETTQRLTTLDVVLDSSAKTLIFASQNNAWEYIGERPITNADDADSFVLSDKLKTAVNDPKWNGFLAKYIK